MGNYPARFLRFLQSWRCHTEQRHNTENKENHSQKHSFMIARITASLTSCSSGRPVSIVSQILMVGSANMSSVLHPQSSSDSTSIERIALLGTPKSERAPCRISSALSQKRQSSPLYMTIHPHLPQGAAVGRVSDTDSTLAFICSSHRSRRAIS